MAKKQLKKTPKRTRLDYVALLLNGAAVTTMFLVYTAADHLSGMIYTALLLVFVTLFYYKFPGMKLTIKNIFNLLAAILFIALLSLFPFLWGYNPKTRGAVIAFSFVALFGLYMFFSERIKVWWYTR